MDDLKATCCPAAAGPAAPLACGLDTPEAADDSCSYECGSAFNEYMEDCAETMAELGARPVLQAPTSCGPHAGRRANSTSVTL